jgi:hypothetical protein
VTRKKAHTVTSSVEAYLASLPLTGAQKPLASTAIILAQSLEDAPGYARARLAKELRDLIVELDAQVARDNEMAERREARRAKGSAWVRDASA